MEISLMERQKKQRKKYRGFWIFFKLQLILLLLLIAAAAYYFGGGYAQTIAELKDDADMLVAKSNVDTFRKGETGLVYDAGGKLLKAYKGEKDAYYIKYADIPEIVEREFVGPSPLWYGMGKLHRAAVRLHSSLHVLYI